MNSLKGDLGGLRLGLRLRSHSDPTHVHAPTITGNSESLRLIIIIFSLSSFALLDLSFTLDDITLTMRPISIPCLLHQENPMFTFRTFFYFFLLFFLLARFMKKVDW
jgi:hypothetical protein